MRKEDLTKIIRESFQESEINEGDRSSKRYMFMSNLKQMCRQAESLMKEDEEVINKILDDGHDWAADHVATAKESLDQVFDFIKNEIHKNNDSDFENTEDEMEEGMGRSHAVGRGQNKKPANYPDTFKRRKEQN